MGLEELTCTKFIVLDNGQLMAAKEDRLPCGPRQLLDQIFDHVGGGWVEAACGFVEEEDWRVMN